MIIQSASNIVWVFDKSSHSNRSDFLAKKYKSALIAKIINNEHSSKIIKCNLNHNDYSQLFNMKQKHNCSREQHYLIVHIIIYAAIIVFFSLNTNLQTNLSQHDKWHLEMKFNPYDI